MNDTSTFLSIMGALIVVCSTIMAWFFKKGGIYNPIETPPTPENPPVEPLPVPYVPDVDPPMPEYLWNTPAETKHSVRLICDEEGLTLEQKNTMCATIGAESVGFNTKAVNENKVNGKVVSTDWGLCQWNDYYHGKEISGGYDGEAMNNPEKAVRLMCEYWKRGQRTLWIAYKNGLYTAYL